MQRLESSQKMNITNIFVKTRELTNSLVFKSRELINSLVFKSRELVNSLDCMKMLVLFIFWLRGIRKFLAIHILVFYFSNYCNAYFLTIKNHMCFPWFYKDWIHLFLTSKISRINCFNHILPGESPYHESPRSGLH